MFFSLNNSRRTVHKQPKFIQEGSFPEIESDFSLVFDKFQTAMSLRVLEFLLGLNSFQW
jgi:hypothetical protein